MNDEKKIELGNEVKDKVSELEGTVVAETNYLFGCRWLCVVPKDLENGMPIEVWLDEKRFEKISDNEEYEHDVSNPNRHGGIMQSKPRRSFPKG